MAYDIANGIVDQRKIDRYWSDFGKFYERSSESTSKDKP
jgi:hypothetical protein